MLACQPFLHLLFFLWRCAWDNSNKELRTMHQSSNPQGTVKIWFYRVPKPVLPILGKIGTSLMLEIEAMTTADFTAKTFLFTVKRYVVNHHLNLLVAGEGLEPPTFWLWARRDTNFYHPAIYFKEHFQKQVANINIIFLICKYFKKYLCLKI